MKHRPHIAAQVGTGCGQQRQHRCALAEWHNWETKDDELHANLGKKARVNLKKEREGRRGGEKKEKEKTKGKCKLGHETTQAATQKDLCIGGFI